jgi:hypothetical protein
VLRLKRERAQNQQVQRALRKIDTFLSQWLTLSLLQENYTASCRSARGKSNPLAPASLDALPRLPYPYD